MTTMLFFCDLVEPAATADDGSFDHACELAPGHPGLCSCECDACAG